MIKIITGSNYKKYLNQGYIEFPENYFWNDDVLEIAESFLIAGRIHNIVIITRDAMLIEAFQILTKYQNEQVTFFLDDVHDDEIIKEEIPSCELYDLYDTLARGYDEISIYDIKQEFRLND